MDLDSSGPIREYLQYSYALAHMLDIIDDLLAALEAVEWEEHYPCTGEWEECPWCEMDKEDGHASDCKRQAAIARAKGIE